MPAAHTPPRPWLACATAGLLAAGCTMCPDPYDYAGPVPDGSPAQNDFQARSNGILPIGAAPTPFPPVVHAAPTPAPEAEEPTDQSSGQPHVAEAADEVLRLSAEEPVDEDPGQEHEPEPVADPISVPPASTGEPPLQETPGWRARG